MKITKVYPVSGFLMAGLLATGAASADIRWSGSVASVTVDTPEVEATLNDSNSPQGEAGGKVDATAITLTASIGLNKGIGLGSDPRLEITAGWLDGDESETERSRTGGLGFVPVDGSGPSDGDGSPDTVLNYDTDIQDISLDIMLREQLGGGQAFSWSAFGGLTLSQSQLDYLFDGSIPGISTEDEIETNYYGVGGGVDGVYSLSENVFLTAGARLDLLARDSDLDVKQEIGANSYRVSDSDSGFSSRLGAQLGIAYKADALTLGLIFSTSYLSDAPTVEHAVLDSNVFKTRLDSTSVTSYGVNLGAGLSF
jgi:hypothetical protein